MTQPADDAATPQIVSAAADAPEESVGAGEERLRNWTIPIGLTALLGYALLALSAPLAWATAFFVLSLVTQAADLVVVHTNGYVRAVLARAQFGIATRSTVRELAAMGLVLGTGWAATDTRRVAAVCVLAVTGLRLLYQLGLISVRRRAMPRVETRNVDLTGLRIPPVPPAVLLTRVSERSHGVSAVAVAGAGLGVAIDSPTLLFVVVGLTLAFELTALSVLAYYWVHGRRALFGDELLAAVRDRIAMHRPEVMLYHSGDAQSAYQVNMWLSTMERLERSAVIVLRERAPMLTLAPTTTPVLCIPDAVDFMTFPLPHVRVALYTANVGKTIHMLREPGVSHCFIGHGDSDKSASSNPFSKVYSEIWVAGEAGRQRYQRAAIGIHDDEIVEVGRPQLDGIELHTGVPAGELTVLYAPTWEGWTNDPAHTSVVHTGPRLVERLVTTPGVRVVYKPHPLTGQVSSAAALADTRIRSTLTRAAAAPGAPRHQVVVGPERSLYDCFNDCHVLVADISSVLSDFIESQKPYVVPNLTRFEDADFRDAFPSASAAYLLDPEAGQVGAVLELIRTGDPMAAQRRELKRFLLGPDDPDAMTRFTRAVDAAYERAVTRWPVRPTLQPATP